jgi:hypothetical protein
MMVLNCESVADLARESRAIESALHTTRAIVFLLPEQTGDGMTVTAIEKLGVGKAFRPGFFVVTPRDMASGGVKGETARIAASSAAADAQLERWKRDLNQINDARRRIALSVQKVAVPSVISEYGGHYKCTPLHKR